MSRARPLQQSFGAGEITPELAGLIESPAYQSGLAECTNFITLPHGPAMYRPGFQFEQYVRNASETCRMLPFVPDDTNAYVLCFTNLACFIHSVAGTAYTATPVAGAFIADHASGRALFKIATATSPQPGAFVYCSSSIDCLEGQWFVCSLFAIVGADSYYELIKPTVGAVAPAFEQADPYPTAGNALSYPTDLHTITSLTTPWTTADLPYLHFAQSLDVLTVTCRGRIPQKISNPGGVWTIAADLAVQSTTTWTAPTLAVTVGAAGTTPVETQYLVTESKPFGNETVELIRDSGFLTIDQADGQVTMTYGAAGGVAPTRFKFWVNAGGYWDLRLDEAIVFSAGTSYGIAGGALTIIAQTGQQPPAGRYVLITYDPRAVAYHEQRKFYAGALTSAFGTVPASDEQTIIGTNPGSEILTRFSSPSLATDAVQFRVASLKRNAIEHLVSLSDLMILTNSAIFVLRAQGGITPTNVEIKSRSYVGASHVQPAVSDNAVLYAASRGGHLYELRYSEESGGHIVTDLCRLAPHLFDGHTVRDMTYQEAPYPILWVVRDDFKLLSCAYNPRLQVIAWHQHETEADIHYVCSIPNGVEDAVFASTARAINGDVGNVLYSIERLMPLLDEDRDTAIRMDCSLTFTGVDVSTVYNLWPLENQVVKVVADGAQLGDRTVLEGRIALDVPADVIHVGLGYQGRLKTLPLTVQNRSTGAYGVGYDKNPTRAAFRVVQSAGIKVGPNLAQLTEPPPRLDEVLGDPPALRTETRVVTLHPGWQIDSALYIVVDEPLPAKVLSMTVEMEVSGR